MPGPLEGVEINGVSKVSSYTPIPGPPLEGNEITGCQRVHDNLIP